MEANSIDCKKYLDKQLSKKDLSNDVKKESGEASDDIREVKDARKPVDEADGKSIKDGPKGAFDEFVRII